MAHIVELDRLQLFRSSKNLAHPEEGFPFYRSRHAGKAWPSKSIKSP